MPIRLNQGNDVSIHANFWNALTSNSDSLALSQLWVCSINRNKLKIIAKRVANDLPSYETGTWNTGLQEAVNNTVLQDVKWTGMSDIVEQDIYLLASGVSFIADGLNTSRIGSDHVGAMKGLISDSRLELNAGNIMFLESNISFVDGLIRPWMALVGHRSLKDQGLRCDIGLYCLEKWSLYEPLHVRKIMKFKNAVPINVDAVELNYTGDKLIERSVQFAFDRYEMSVFPAIATESITSITLVSDKTETSESKKSTGIKRTDLPNQPVGEIAAVPSTVVNIEENGYLVDDTINILAAENTNIPNTSPIPTAGANAYKRDRKFIIPIKNKYKNNTSPKPKANKNDFELNVSPVPSSAVNTPEDNVSPVPIAGENSFKANNSPIPLDNKNIYKENASPVPKADRTLDLSNESPIPSDNKNIDKSNESPVPVAVENQSKPNENAVPAADTNRYIIADSIIPAYEKNKDKPNVSPLVFADIISTGR